MKSKNTISGLTPLQFFILNEPTQRLVLWVIHNQPKTFSVYFQSEILKRQDLLKPNSSPNLLKAIIIYQNLLEKGMVNASDPLKTKVSWKGQFYRTYTHPFFIPFATTIGIVTTLLVGISTIHSKPPPETITHEILKEEELPMKSGNLSFIDSTAYFDSSQKAKILDNEILQDTTL